MPVLLFLSLFSNSAAAERFTVAAWNINKGGNIAVIERELTRPPLSEAVLIALQEALTEPKQLQEKRLARAIGAQDHAAGRDAILSKWPLINRGEVLVNPETGRRAAWADARSPEGRVIRFYSLHLSYKIGRNPFVPHVRAAELRALLDHAEAFEGPVVVAGDLNTVGWLFCCGRDEPSLRLLKIRGYTDVLETAKVGCNTQHVVGTVDWIFVRGLTPISAVCGRYAGSDHRWILGTLQN